MRGVYKMVMSIGWNPYFDNTEKTIVSVLSTLGYNLNLNKLSFCSFKMIVNDFRSHGCYMTLTRISMVRSYALLLLDIYGLRYHKMQLILFSKISFPLILVLISLTVSCNMTGQFPVPREPGSENS